MKTKRLPHHNLGWFIRHTIAIAGILSLWPMLKPAIIKVISLFI